MALFFSMFEYHIHLGHVALLASDVLFFGFTVTGHETDMDLLVNGRQVASRFTSGLTRVTKGHRENAPSLSFVAFVEIWKRGNMRSQGVPNPPFMDTGEFHTIFASVLKPCTSFGSERHRLMQTGHRA